MAEKKIKDIFEHDINRTIAPVVKPELQGVDIEENELKEYVVTKELSKHFQTFFANYDRSIDADTEEIGAWISGFYGSGKSHFLKVLAYMLRNNEVGGKKAIDYIIDKPYIAEDPMVVADIRKAGQQHTKAILFDIPSKAQISIRSESSVIALTFNRVFNEMQGYSSETPALADLEASLDDDGTYNQFKAEVEKASGMNYKDFQRKFKTKRQYAKQALIAMGHDDEATADAWIKDATGNYDIAIDTFVDKVKHYIDKTGNRVVFLVDEVGQFIAKDASILLDLQTLEHELGAKCRGKAWLIVTAQEDLKHMVDEMQLADDQVSKIKGRFLTKLSLSSVDADEVIKERILKKHDDDEQALEVLYETNETDILTRDEFSNTKELKQIKSPKDFADCYPFLPYQFNLLSDVYQQLISNAVAARNNSEGERSLLEAFQHAAKNIENKEEGAIVPFYAFYDVLGKYLDHTHAGVIERARDNERLNPTHDEDCDAVNVLETLFLLKYVKGVPMTVGNIQTFMYTDIHQDKQELHERILVALEKLDKEMLITSYKDTYEFLTDEEQDINKGIEQMPITMADVTECIRDQIFDTIFTDTSYRADSKGRYIYPFNRTVDNSPKKGNQNNEIGLRFLTPSYSGGVDDATMMLESAQRQEVVFVLPQEEPYFNNLRRVLKINAYLQNNPDPKQGKSTLIREAKKQEANDRKGQAVDELEQAIADATIYINGNRNTSITSQDPDARINDALKLLVDAVYYKRSYMTATKNDADIRALFDSYEDAYLNISGVEEENANALTEMKDYINEMTGNHTTISMKQLIDEFHKSPCGFNDTDVRWLVAKLFHDGKISASVNKDSITVYNRDPKELYDYFTNRKYNDLLVFVAIKEVADEKIKDCKDIMKKLFSRTETTNDPAKLMSAFNESAGAALDTYRDKLEEHNRENGLPGEKVLRDAIETVQKVVSYTELNDFFDKLYENYSKLREIAEDVVPVINFYNSTTQRNIFKESGLDIIALYDKSKFYFTGENDVAQIISDIRSIVEDPKPYKRIKDLPNLGKSFMTIYDNVLSEHKKPVLDKISQLKENAISHLDIDELKEEYALKIDSAVQGMVNQINDSKEIPFIDSFTAQAQAYFTTTLTNIDNDRIAIHNIQTQSATRNNGTLPDEPSVEPVQPTKTITHVAASNVAGTSWSIENEQELDEHLKTLREKIMTQLADDKVTIIDF